MFFVNNYKLNNTKCSVALTTTRIQQHKKNLKIIVIKLELSIKHTQFSYSTQYNRYTLNVHTSKFIDVITWLSVDYITHTHQNKHTLFQRILTLFDVSTYKQLVINTLQHNITHHKLTHLHTLHHVLLTAWCITLHITDLPQLYRYNSKLIQVSRVCVD